MNAHAEVILPSDAAGGIAMVAVGALRCCCSGRDAHAEVILPSDAAGGIAMVAVIVAADAHCDVGSPPQRAEAMPAIRAADGVGAPRCC